MSVNLKCTYDGIKDKVRVKLSPADNPVDLSAGDEQRLICLGLADKVVKKVSHPVQAGKAKYSTKKAN